MLRFLPSRAVLLSALAAFVAIAATWLRLDARKAERAALREKDFKHAQDIWSASARARRNRADGVRPHANRGWRD